MSVASKRLAAVASALALAGILLLVALADPALAADTTRIGENLGAEVKSWGKALLFGVAALVGLPAMARRDPKEALLIGGIALILGGFLFAPEQMESIIRGLMKTVAG
jgi:hypothetical protein